MKLKLLAAALGMTLSFAATAGPVLALPEGPLFIKFENREQIAINGANTGYANEINWGVLRVSTIEFGNVVEANDQIGGSGNFFFINNNSTGGFSQITGIFYGIESYTGATAASNPFPAQAGILDLYWRDVSALGIGGNLTDAFDSTKRTAQDKYTGFTEGTLLVRLLFDTGIDPVAEEVTIAGTVIPSGTAFNGLAESYSSVDTSVVAPWSDALNGDWFTTTYGTQRDLRFKNSYSNLSDWDGGENVLGAKSDDPGQAFAVPEPTTLALVGLSLFGLGYASRRKSL